MIITRLSGNSYSTNSLRMNFWAQQLLDRLLFFIKPVVEYALGMHIGFAFGWLTGLCAGYFYVNHSEPLYLDDLSELSFWTTAPYMFARYGAIAGSLIGLLAILIINSKMLNQRITELCEKGTTNPNQIARILDCRSGKIKRKMTKLVQKGRISRKPNSP